MARATDPADEPPSVEELLRETGARPRHRAGDTAAPRPRPPSAPLGPDEHRARLERQAQDAALRHQRTGKLIRRATLGIGFAAVLGCLVVIAVTAGSPHLSQSTLQVPPVAAGTPSSTPRTTPPATSSAATVAPVPATISATRNASSSPPAVVKPPKPPAEHATCSVRYAVQDQWETGFGVAITIANTGDTPISPWSLSWTYRGGQRVTQGWDGTYDQTGDRVTVDAASWNTAIPAGGSVSTGFNGALNGSNPAPTSFTLNGTTCALG